VALLKEYEAAKIEIKRFKHKEEYWLKNIIVQQQLTKKSNKKKINKNPYFSEKSSNCCAPLNPPHPFYSLKSKQSSSAAPILRLRRYEYWLSTLLIRNVEEI